MPNAVAGAQVNDLRALGSTAFVTAAPNNVTSLIYENAHLIKAGPSMLYGFSGFNSKGSAQFIQVYDAVQLPADGAIPVVVLTVSATANFSYNPGVYGRRFANGIVIANSSTGPTKTIGSADCFFDVQVR